MAAAVQVPSAFDRAHMVTIDVYGRNPLVDDVRQLSRGGGAGTPPKMFTDGTADLPAFTAAGFDPVMLLQLPYTCRHYAAAVDDRAGVARLFEECSADPYAYLDHEGLRDAIGRVRKWAIGPVNVGVAL